MIDLKAMLPIFSSVFMAELGDKTQLATVCFMAGGGGAKMEVFVASAGALVLSTFLAVLCGAAIGRIVPPHFLKIGAGVIFMVMGALFIRQGRGGRPEEASGSEGGGHEA
ncbi:MAG: TMEM165/GDT1 family protein [Candidatus Adiutrix sp.]|jgi:putative Ca2+/H+ antiporter (TMEM165/GDT1 family)|nr:TMEM165/GDT1 family protein [Candidatus Adiutrix sp.]